MKFTYYLEKIHGVSIYPIVSLTLFVLFFLIVLIWTYRSDSKTIKYIENLPLEDDEVSIASERKNINR